VAGVERSAGDAGSGGAPPGPGGLGPESRGGENPVGAGLCDSCAHQQVVRNTRGSAFSLCGRSRTEPDRFPRYPRVPVTRCEGWKARA
jgi:hypothetical protein